MNLEPNEIIEKQERMAYTRFLEFLKQNKDFVGKTFSQLVKTKLWKRHQKKLPTLSNLYHYKNSKRLLKKWHNVIEDLFGQNRGSIIAGWENLGIDKIESSEKKTSTTQCKTEELQTPNEAQNSQNISAKVSCFESGNFNDVSLDSEDKKTLDKIAQKYSKGKQIAGYTFLLIIGASLVFAALEALHYFQFPKLTYKLEDSMLALFSEIKNVNIFYTLDKKNPTISSQQYKDKFQINITENTIVKARAYFPTTYKPASRILTIDDEFFAWYLAKQYHTIGFSYWEKEQYEKSIEYYNKALKLKPDYFDALSNRGASLLMIGTNNALIKALVDCNEALKIDPNNKNRLNTLNTRGSIYMLQRKFKEALTDFNVILEQNSNNETALQNRGNLFASMDDFDNALIDFNHILKHNPNSNEVLRDKVKTLTDRGIYFFHNGGVSPNPRKFRGAV